MSDTATHTNTEANRAADIDFYFDPVCPFAWMTSKWVRLVHAQRDYTVGWRFISLRLINSAIDYDAHFQAGYEAGHTAGLRLLRVAARTRAEHGRAAIGPLYAAPPARRSRCCSASDSVARRRWEPVANGGRMEVELEHCGPRGARTRNLRIKSPQLCQLS
jgi:hypothetical protein